MKIFFSVKEWWLYVKSAAIHLVKGIARIVYAVVMGVVSVIVWLWRCMVGFVRNHPSIALGGFIVVVSVVWLLMFAQIRATKVGLEAQRDSIAYQFSYFKESHGYE